MKAKISIMFLGKEILLGNLNIDEARIDDTNDGDMSLRANDLPENVSQFPRNARHLLVQMEHKLNNNNCLRCVITPEE